MKPILFLIPILLVACGQPEKASDSLATVSSDVSKGQSDVQDDVSQRNIVQVASASADHSTLVGAIKAADYVNALANAGPFTVFAPTNAAFEKLPEGTLDDLVKPENKSKLQDILEYHVYVGVINENMIPENTTLNQVNLKNVTVNKKDGKITVNGANVLGQIKTSNGIIYSIDAVLLPPEK